MKHHTVVFAGVLCAVYSTFVDTVRGQNERPEGLVAVWGLYTIAPARMTNITRVAAGDDWSLAVGSNGKVLFWGRTSQLGDETGLLPASLSSNMVDVAAGSYGLALRNDGTPLVWGHNNYVPGGQLSADAGLSNVVKIISGRHDEFWAIKNDRTAAPITSYYLPMCPFPNLSGVADIAPQALNFNCSQWGYGLILYTNGTVESYGQRNGQPVIVAPEAQNSIAIAAGDYTGMVLKSNGTVVCWSIFDGNTNTDSAFGDSLVPPASATNVVAIAAGTHHYMALRGDGTVVTWGSLAGSVEPPAGLTNVIQISAGVRHCLALKSDGTVLAWGASTGVGIMPGDRGVKVATADQDIYLVRKDGTVGHMGISAVPEGLTNIVELDTDPSGHAIALRSDGTVVTWANGLSTVPSDATNMTAVAAGGVSFIGTSLNVNLRSNHTMYVWGSSGLNNLPPDGNPNDHALQGYPNVSAIDACGDNIVVLTTGGEVRAWSFQSLLTPPTNATGLAAAEAGTTSVLGLKNDGTVITWGVAAGFDGLVIPVDATNIVKIAAKSVSCAGCRNVVNVVLLRADGTVLSLGGPYGPPSALAGVFDITTSGFSSAALFVPPDPPSVTRFCPPAGDPGTVVEMVGAGFLPVTGVSFNGVAANFSNSFNFILHAAVPAGATTGPIVITSPYGSATITNFVVPNGMTPIETWRVLNFNTAANTGLGADTADPDGDGVVNLLEYFMHTDPNVADRQPGLIARQVIDNGAQRSFEFAQRHNSAAGDVSVHYEFKYQILEPWQPYVGPVVDVGTQPLECVGQYEFKRVSVPVLTNEFHLRYYITRP